MRPLQTSLEGVLPAHKVFLPSRSLGARDDGSTVCTFSGDWDLSPVAVSDVVTPTARRRARASSATKPVSVAIGRTGDVFTLCSESQLDQLRIVDHGIAVRVVGRHPLWNAFRDELKAYAAQEPGLDGLLYAPLTHIDLRDIPAWTGTERFDALVKYLGSGTRTVLDIGANLGYMCCRLEDLGCRCVAVEGDDACFHWLQKIRRAGRHDFDIFHGDIADYIQPDRYFDVVLCLAVFHHMLKTKVGHEKLVAVLSKLRMGELFLWTHNPREAQMVNAYRNYDSLDFARFVVDHSCLSFFEAIGEFHHRVLLRIFR